VQFCRLEFLTPLKYVANTRDQYHFTRKEGNPWEPNLPGVIFTYTVRMRFQRLPVSTIFFPFLPELPEIGKFKMDYQSIFATIIQRLLLTKYATRDRVVRAFFGLSIPMLSRVYWLISQPGGRGEFVAPMDLLIALHFVKKYETEDISCILFRISGKTWKSHRDAALVALYLRLPEVCLTSFTLL
jgi:hypothetical protein